jgi:hypothetical protein
MRAMAGLKRPWESIMSIGSFAGETDIERGKRRILVG